MTGMALIFFYDVLIIDFYVFYLLESCCLTSILWRFLLESSPISNWFLYFLLVLMSNLIALIPGSQLYLMMVPMAGGLGTGKKYPGKAINNETKAILN